jgi:hypothetical protein
VCAAINPQGKQFGDLLGGTIVIRTRAPRGPRPLPLPPRFLEPDVFLTAVSGERRRREIERVRARQWVPIAAELPTGRR